MILLQFVNSSSFGARAIDWFEAGTFSHVDAVLSNGLLGARSNVLGQVPAGVQIRPFGYEQWHRRIQLRIDATDQQTQDFYGFLTKQLGKPYDKTAIFAFIINRDWQEDDSWFCSELQAAALTEAKVLRPCPYVHVNKITPAALAMMVCSLPNSSWEVRSYEPEPDQSFLDF